MGHGTVPASGLKKGVVVNIDQTVRSIADAVERAERLSGWKIDRAFVGVGGQHVESLNSTGQVAVTAHHREVTREDINRAIEVARAVSIPSNRDVLHVERRGFTVDGQEGVKDPLGHERPAAGGRGAHRVRLRHRGPEPHQVRPARRGQDRRARRRRARVGRGGPHRDREGAGGRGRGHRRRDDRPRPVRGRVAVPHLRPAGRRQQRDQRRRDRRQDDAPGRRGAQGPPRDLRPPGHHRRGDQRLRPGRGRRPHGEPRGAVPDHRGPDARDLRARAPGDGPQRPRHAARRGSS